MNPDKGNEKNIEFSQDQSGVKKMVRFCYCFTIFIWYFFHISNDLLFHLSTMIYYANKNIEKNNLIEKKLKKTKI